MTGRVGLLENTGQRVTPRSAKVTLALEVTDAQFFSIARFSAAVSIVLMVVVACFFAFAAWRHAHDGTPSPEVLASALTLFSVIQAGRVEAPDRSTLRGKLTGPGNWLIIASILPTVVLAVALAFGITGWAAVSWAGTTIVVQGLFMVAMWRGPLSAMGGQGHPPHRVLRTTPTPAHVKTAALHANWWRSTTATALVVGRRAHGYLIWEHRTQTGTRPDDRDHGNHARRDGAEGAEGVSGSAANRCGHSSPCSFRQPRQLPSSCRLNRHSRVPWRRSIQSPGWAADQIEKSRRPQNP